MLFSYSVFYLTNVLLLIFFNFDVPLFVSCDVDESCYGIIIKIIMYSFFLLRLPTKIFHYEIDFR